MKNKYQEAFNEIKEHITRKDHWWSVQDERTHLATLQELVDKETPMKVDKKDFLEYDCDDDDYDYFPLMTFYYRCPNRKRKLHRKYELSFETERCPICNQLLDWSDTDE